VYRRVATRRFAEWHTEYDAEQDRWLEVRVYPGTDGLSIYFQDVSERKRSEQALFESEAFSRGVFEGSPDCVKVLDAEGRLLQMNANGQCVMEIDDFAPLAGRQWSDLWPDHVREVVVTSLATARTAGVSRFQRECPTAKGTLKWWDVLVAPILDASGNVVRFVSVSRDITERIQAENELKETNLKFQMLADNMSQFAWTADAQGSVFWYNQRWYDYTGTSLEEMRGWGWKSVQHPDHADRVVERVQQSWDSGEPWEDTFPLRGKDGSYRWFLTRAMPIRDEQGQLVRWFGTNTDVTDQRETAEELRCVAAALSEADRRKNEFLATLAHELRNPLAPIRNGLQVMLLAKDNVEMVEHSRTMMERQLDHMVRLVDDLMDVSRITRGKLELKREHLELADVINSAVETSRPLIEQMGHTLQVSMPAEPIIINADLTRLAQAILNLLNNAAKYSERNGQIWLTAERQANDVIISIRDTGIGLDADQLPRSFEMFSQVDNSLGKSQGGLGIGLTLVRRLVEMHDGNVEAHSAGPGTGSEFIVRLPLVVEAPDAPRADRDGQFAQSKSTLRILIVDDNRDGADSLSMFLRVMGNDTRTAYDGAQAVVAVGEFRPEVILLDIGLPILNGYEACRSIRTQPGGKEVVIIAQTGWGQDEDRKRTHDAGFDLHLVKPVDPLALMKLLTGLSNTAEPLPGH